MNIKKGDNIIVLSGKDRGRKGKVLRVIPKKDMVLVEGVNMKKRHKKARNTREKGQIVSIATPIRASTIAIADPKTGKPTRIGAKFLNGKKVRVAKKSGATI